MRLKTVLQRMAGGILAAVMVVGSMQPVTAAESEFPAAFEHQESSYIVNGNFDGTDNFVNTGAAQGVWFLFNGQKATDMHHSGSTSVLLPAAGNAVDQRVELKANTTYELSAWIYAEEGKGARLRAFLNGGAVQEDKKLLDTDENCNGKWYQYTSTFTTDDDTTYADIGVVRAHNSLGTDGNVWVDDIAIKEEGAPVSAQRIDSETIQVQYPETRTEEPGEDDVTLLYSIGEGNPAVEQLSCQITWDESKHIATLTHNDVAESTEIVANFDLQISGETFVQTVTLPADSDYVAPQLKAVEQLENGSAVLILESAPTKDLTAGQITISYTDYDGNPATASVTKVEKISDVSYAVEFGKIAPRETDKTYELAFEVGGKTVNSSLTVQTTKGKTFYLDATNGNDENDGMSPETAWKTLDKVNDTVFMEGSSLLLKAGETWTGTLAPKGSGAEGAPIILSSYGEGDRPRILMDENAAYEETIMRVAAIKTRKVNETFRLHNQSWWEISNIEFQNAAYEEDQPVDPNRALERGMYITAEDAGQLDHIYISNVWIHGFQTSDSGNTGKESGGIIFLISANEDAAKRQPTWFNDIKITNCTVEDVGRSGFFLLSPWKTREMTADGRWGGRWEMVNDAGEGSLGEFTPTTDVYIGSNIFRNISGDGIILQCMDGAVAEYNLVDEVCTGNWFAAGIFPYLVSNGTVQYNELCRTHRGADAQGVEIDALNENFEVLYNYSHENSGGFVQFCALQNLPTFDSYYAFNISENDGSTSGTGAGSNGLLMPLAGTINCSVFNNTIYFNPKASIQPDGYDKFFIPHDGSRQSVAIYNNIFYRADDEYKFNDAELEYFNSMGALAEDNFVEQGGRSRFANNMFYNFSTEGLDTDSSFYQDNTWGQDPLLADPGTMGDGDADALIKDHDIISAWNLDVYKLDSSSPAIDAGRTISSEYGEMKDILGNEVDMQNPDLGAIQYEENVDPAPEVDKTKLEKLLTKADGYLKQIDIYTPSTAEAFQAAYDNAKAVYEGSAATQEAVDSAYNVLQQAIFGLREIPNKDKLEDLIDEAEELDLSKYTDESAQAVRQALAEAKSVLADENALAEDVETAERNLSAAIDNLVVKDDTQDPAGPENPGNKDDQKPAAGDDSNKTSSNKAAKTGDSTQVSAVLTLAVLAAGMTLIMLAGRKKYFK